jgi:CRISPR-associated protein Cmr5
MKKGYDGLLHWITDPETSSDDYRRATTECLAFGAWLRRFAEGELEEPETGENI